MNFFDNLYQKFFASKATPGFKLHNEVIKRHAKYLYHYQEWKDSDRPGHIISDYSKSYYLKHSGIESEPGVHVFNSPAANGFAFTYHPSLGKDEFQYLFDLLADKVKLLGYRMVNSDVYVAEKADFIETREKHYLKPPLSAFDKTTDQYYGNILVEYIKVNDEPSYIKLLANTYSDRLYMEPRPYNELIEHLFGFE